MRRPFLPDSTAVLAFAEARLANGGDSGEHAMAFVRSTNFGAPGSWEPARYLYNDTNPHRDGFNLGAAVYAHIRLLFNRLSSESVKIALAGDGRPAPAAALPGDCRGLLPPTRSLGGLQPARN